MYHLNTVGLKVTAFGQGTAGWIERHGKILHQNKGEELYFTAKTYLLGDGQFLCMIQCHVHCASLRK